MWNSLNRLRAPGKTYMCGFINRSGLSINGMLPLKLSFTYLPSYTACQTPTRIRNECIKVTHIIVRQAEHKAVKIKAAVEMIEEE